MIVPIGVIGSFWASLCTIGNTGLRCIMRETGCRGCPGVEVETVVDTFYKLWQDRRHE